MFEGVISESMILLRDHYRNICEWVGILFIGWFVSISFQMNVLYLFDILFDKYVKTGFQTGNNCIIKKEEYRDLPGIG